MSDTTQNEQPKANGAPSPLVFKLRKAVIANGDEVTELTFREPTAADIERVGNPVNLDFFQGDTPKATFDAKAMTNMMSLLAAVPPSAIRGMHPRDWNTIAWSIAPFFMPELG